MGHDDPAYHNDNFREISVGSNRLLRTIDLRNCSGLGIAGKTPQKTLELSGCPNIEHIYTEGTNLESVDLPDSGYIKTLHLPASINTLIIKNQPYISDFSVESYAKIRTLCLENCPTLNTDDILAACRADGRYTVERVRLTGIDWTFEDASFVKSLFPVFDSEGNIISSIRGIDEKNNNLDDAYLVGECYIAELTGAEYSEIKAHYPFLNISFGKMTSTITFNYSDADSVAHTETVSITSLNSQLGDISDYVSEQTPYWPENDAFTYEFIGWSRKQHAPDGVDDDIAKDIIHSITADKDYWENYYQADALIDIAGDRVLYPVFKAHRKSYPVTFINPTAPEDKQKLATVYTLYGSNAVYSGPVPQKLDASSPDLYEHTGWWPTPTNITGPTTCYAQFAFLDEKWYVIGINDISDCTDSQGNIFDGYTLNNSAKTIAITKCKNDLNAAVRIPNTLLVESVDYAVTNVGGFANHIKLELVDLPDTLKTLAANAFNGCHRLYEIEFPAGLTTIGAEALYGCSKIKEIHITSNITDIGAGAFTACPLEIITVADDNTVYEVANNCLIKGKGQATGKILVKGMSTGTIPDDGSVTELLSYCFANTDITGMVIPESITTISNNAFSRCYNLTTIQLPNTLEVLDATCFAWCNKLTGVVLPSCVKDIKTYAFNSCALDSIVIPGSVNNVLERSFGDMPSLKTVTFEPKLDANGNIKAPYIHKNAFINSGNDSIVFNVPWSKDYDYQYFETIKNQDGIDTTIKIDPTGWGAKNFTINYNYVEA
jgi:hypothetical protein